MQTKTITEMELVVAGLEWGDEWIKESRFPTLRRECPRAHASFGHRICCDHRGWVAVSAEADLNRWLTALAEEGWCPNLINDDNGKWALVTEGTQPVVQGDEKLHITTLFMDEDTIWCDEPYEAVVKAVYETLKV